MDGDVASRLFRGVAGGAPELVAAEALVRIPSLEQCIEEEIRLEELVTGLEHACARGRAEAELAQLLLLAEDSARWEEEMIADAIVDGVIEQRDLEMQHATFLHMLAHLPQSPTPSD